MVMSRRFPVEEFERLIRWRVEELVRGISRDVSGIVEEALDDPVIDAVVAGIVPLTPAMQTLPPGEGHRESILDPGSIARLLPAVAAATDKPLLAVVDSGVLFDPLADALQAGGLPVFRSADRAVRALGRWVGEKQKRA